MNLPVNQRSNIPPEQQAIRDRCFHPSGTFVEFPIEDVETSIPARFEKMVRMYPEHLAFKIVDQTATYAEINSLANQFACDLVDKLGLGSEPIGLLIENGVELLVAMFGILKAGKFVVSVDPKFPAERAKAIFAESQVRLIVTDATHKSLAWTLCEYAANLTIDTRNPSLAVKNLDLAISATAPAFLLYTSGSTGHPKGVINNHRSLLYSVMERTNEFHLCQNDKMSLLTSGTANAIANSLRTLLSGASLHAVDIRRRGVAGLANWLLEEEITVCSIGVSLFREFCKTHTVEEPFDDLRILGLRSESVLKSDFDLYKNHFPASCLLVNGITVAEAGLLAMYFIDHHTEVCGHEVPIGYAVKNKDISLIDDDGEDVGFNRVGEIVVRSRYLSPGYWNNSDLTAAKFKADPQDPDKVIYCTGDLGMMLPDGCLIHKGRKDFRLKIRGYGVDLVEAENALRSHPIVNDAIVVGRQYDEGDTRLIAYFTSSIESGPTTSELRKYLSQVLADYMIPSAFIRLDVLPVTLNGKIDRRALPDPDRRRPDLDNPFVAPRTHVEKTVARIVSECTGIEPVGIYDSFFDLGGDSLTLARLVSRVNVAFERDVPVQYLYESATVAGIARWLEAAASSSQFICESSLSPIASESPRELSYSQQRLWFLDQLHPRDPLYNLLTAFQITGRLNIGALERTLNEVVARHEVLRTVFDSVDGRSGLKLLPNLVLAIPVIDLEAAGTPLEDDVFVKQHCAALVRQPFDLSQGPLIRVCLLRQSDDRHVLVVVAHHIVFDGWSMGVLWRELAVGYQALCQGRPISLPKLAVQYADYARWQRDRLRKDRLQDHLQYWQRQLDGFTRLQLPIDRPRPLHHASKGAKRHFILSAKLTTRLKRLSHDHGATLFMTLMAAFQALLHRYTSQDDISIGCAVAGRSRPEVENLIGFFLNILILRVDSSGAPRFVELLERVRHACLSAYAYQDMPFEKLVEELNPDRELNRHPFVDVMFAFQNTPRVVPQLYDAAVSQFDIDNGIARFDLQLYIEEICGQLRGYFSYNTDLFHDQTIARMCEHFSSLIESIVTDPAQRISDFALFTENQATRASDTELAQVLCEVEAMTDEEALKLLAGENMERTRVDGHE